MWVFDAGDDPQTPTAIWALLDIDGEHPLEALRPCHGRQWLVAVHPAWSSPWHDPVPVPGVGCKDSVEAGQVQSRAWNDGCEPGHDVQRLQNHMRRPIPKWPLAAVHHPDMVID